MENLEKYNEEISRAEHISSMETPFSEINALSIIQQPTNDEWIKSRKISGRTLSYVSGDLVIRVLNKAFRNRWSFEVKETRVINSVANKDGVEQNPVVQVLGRLTVPGWGVREQWGAQPIVGGQDTQEHAFKSAATDCMKKCASMFGVTLDLYGREGMADLAITPQDYLRDDDATFDKMREKLLARQEDKDIPTAEPDETELNEEDDSSAQKELPNLDNVAKDPVQHLSPEEVIEESVPVESVPVENTKPINNIRQLEPEIGKPVWAPEDIEDMKRIKDTLGLKDNEALDSYVQAFTQNDQAVMRRHITPTNVRDFITYMERNHLN